MAVSRLDLATAIGFRQAGAQLRRRRCFARFETDARRALYERIWAGAAAATGADIVSLSPEIVELRRGPSATRVWRQITELDDAVTMHATLDKPLMHRCLAAAGLPLPDSVVYRPDDLGEAADLLTASPGDAFVVKPAIGTGGGLGVTTGVRSMSDLSRATLRAARFGSPLLLERQPPGAVLRLLYLDGELLDAVCQGPPTLIGDGASPIVALIDAENERRLAAGGELGPALLRLDLDCLLRLRDDGRRLGEAPASGERFAVKGASNENARRDRRRVSVPAPLAEIGRRAADAAGLRLSGVDMVVRDPERDRTGTVIEVNGGPGLHHHYLVADAEPAQVAVPILETLLERSPRPAMRELKPSEL